MPTILEYIRGISSIFSKTFLLLPEHGESTEDARRTDHERLVSGSLATDGEGNIHFSVLNNLLQFHLSFGGSDFHYILDPVVKWHSLGTRNARQKKCMKLTFSIDSVVDNSCHSRTSSGVNVYRLRRDCQLAS